VVWCQRVGCCGVVLVVVNGSLFVRAGGLGFVVVGEVLGESVVQYRCGVSGV